MIEVVSEEQYNCSMKIKDLLATYKEAEDLINIGAYTPGSNDKIDQAIAKIDTINGYLRQGIKEGSDMDQSIESLKMMVGV